MAIETVQRGLFEPPTPPHRLHINTTMEIYTHARMEKKRQAQSKVVDVLFGREREMAHRCDGKVTESRLCAHSVPVLRPRASRIGSKLLIWWWAQQDSNLRLPPCDGAAPSASY
jgi:hypothetical protein